MFSSNLTNKINISQPQNNQIMKRNRYQIVSPMTPMSCSPILSAAIAEECANTKCKSGENIDRTSLQKQLGLPIPVSFERVFIRKEDIPLSTNLLSKYVSEENIVSPEEDVPEVEEAPELLTPEEERKLRIRARRLRMVVASRPSEFTVCGEMDNRIVCASIDAHNMTITYISDSKPKRTYDDEPAPAPRNVFVGRFLEKIPQSHGNFYPPSCDNLKTFPDQKRQRIFSKEIRDAIGK